MSDLAPSMIDAASQPASTPTLDASQFDKNIRQINLVTNSWSLPQIPDATKLDLASLPGVDHKALNTLLVGIDRDLNQDGIPDRMQEQSYRVPQLQDSLQPTGYDETRRIVSGLASEARPTDVTGDAVKRWKMSAIDKGYLDPPQNGAIDSTWSPEFETIRKQMAWDDTNAQYRGDHPGSITFAKAVDQIGKWTSPSGLLKAATDLDLWWDTGAIQKDLSTWGDKWRKLGKSKNPWDFAGNLIDAVTGPIDDVVLPVVNWALLVGGVSEAYQFGKLAMLGKDAVVGAEAMDGLYQGGKFASFINGIKGYKSESAVAKDVLGMMEPSGLANRLIKADNVAANFVGDQLAGWRSMKSVATGKKFIQAGMRLGIASQAEDLLPSYHGGSFGDTAAVKNVVSWADKNPLLAGAQQMTDILFVPYSTFRPGSIIGTAKSLGGGAATALGTVPGRAAAGFVIGAGAGAIAGQDLGSTLAGGTIGAIGMASFPIIGRSLETAGKGITNLSERSLVGKGAENVGDFLQKFSFKPITQNERFTASVHQGLTEAIKLKEPEKLDQYLSDFDQHGFLGAFSRYLGVDEEAAGAALTHTLLSASIDHIASSLSKSAGTDNTMYRRVRNKLTAQIRGFNLEDVGAHTLSNVAARAAKGVGDEKTEFQRLLTEFKADPNLALQYAQKHNAMAQDTIRQLVSVESIPDLNPEAAARIYGWAGMTPDDRLGVFQSYLPQVIDSFGRWPQYSAHMSQMRQSLEAGHLDDAVFSTWTDANGIERAVRKVTEPVADTMATTVPTKSQQISQGVNNHIFRGDGDTEKTLGSSLDVLARGDDPGQGRFTLMRKDSPTKQDMFAKHSELKELYRANTTVSSLPKSLAEVKRDAGVPLDTMTQDEFVGAFTRVGRDGSVKAINDKQRKSLGRLYSYARKNGISLDDIDTGLRGRIDAAIDDPMITDWFGLGQGVRAKPEPGQKMTSVLGGMPALKERMRQLYVKAQFTAADIDHGKLLANLGEGTPEFEHMAGFLDSMDRAGYKLSHGVEFLTPEDVAFHTPILADITTRHLNAVTLGNFFKGKLPEVAREQANRRNRLAIIDELDKAGSKLDLDPDSQTVTDIVSDLRSVLDSEKNVADDVRNNAANGSWLQKRVAAVKTSTTPITLTDLRTRQGAVLDYLVPRYGEQDSKAIYRALARMRESDFKDVGLAAIEQKLRSNNQLADGLKFLSGTDHGAGFVARTSSLRKFGAVAGAGYATQTNGDGNDYLAAIEGGVIGGALGTAAQGALSPLAQKGALLFDNSKWFKYGYIADNLARLRDTMRFTLSPFFDVSRYTEGMMLGQTAAPLRAPDGSRLVMPANMSPSKIMKAWAKEAGGGVNGKLNSELKWNGLLSDFKQASKQLGHEVDPQATDSMANWFQQVGIMGFNPTNWQTAAFHHLREAGFSSDDAFRHAKEMYTYGTHGRSAAEMSVNFVLFPFSFQKKTYTHLAKYLADDQSRAIILHDALKTYDTLNEKYDLGGIWKEHIPALEMLQRLNLFAYGLSPGRLGGINRPYIEPLMNAAANAHGQSEFVPGILNLFSPQGFSVKSAAQAAEVQKIYKSLLPVINDTNQLMHDAHEQGHVLSSPMHQTNAADARDGWEAWNTYKSDLNHTLDAQGYSFSDMARKPWLANMNAQYKAKQAELGQKFPGWRDSRTKSLMNFEALNAEKQERLNKAAAGLGNEADNMMASFEEHLKPIKDSMKSMGITDPADVPPEVFQGVQDVAVQFAKRNLEFRRIWKRFYQKDWGIIEAQVGQ